MIQKVMLFEKSRDQRDRVRDQFPDISVPNLLSTFFVVPNVFAPGSETVLVPN